MSNPNSFLLSSNKDDDDDGFTPFAPKKQKKLFPLNSNVINFSLNKQKEQQARKAGEQNKVQEDSPEDSEDDETGEIPTASRRKKAGRRLKMLIKRSHSKQATTIKQEEFPATPISTSEADGSEPMAATANLQPATENQVVSEKIKEEAEAEAVPINPLEIQPIGEVSDATKDKILPSANKAAPPPLPPPIPASVVARGNSGGNLNSLPDAISSANSMPPVPHPALLNQAPAMVEKGEGTKAAWTAFLAATYFRRRGEQRTNSKIKETNDRLEQTQQQLKSETQRIRSTERAVGPQGKELQRFDEPNAGSQEIPMPAKKNYDHPAQPVKAAEVFAASPLARKVGHKEAAKPTELAETKVPDLKNSESANQPVKEVFFDRRHEVKDAIAPKMPTSPNVAKTRSSSAGPQAVQDNFYATNPIAQTALGPPSLPSGPGDPQDLYKQSMRAGFLMGLIVIVIGIMALSMHN